MFSFVLLKSIVECTPKDHPDFQNSKHFYEELIEIKQYIERRQEEALKTKEFWTQHPSLEVIYIFYSFSKSYYFILGSWEFEIQ
jgi:hypothetical protein